MLIGVNLLPIGWLLKHEPDTDCGPTEACSLKLGGLDWLQRLKTVLGYRTDTDWLNRIKTWSARSTSMTHNLSLAVGGHSFYIFNAP